MLLLLWKEIANDDEIVVEDATEAEVGIGIMTGERAMTATIEARVMIAVTVTDDMTILAAPTLLAIITLKDDELQLATLATETFVVSHAAALRMERSPAGILMSLPTLRTIKITSLSPLGLISILLVTARKTTIPLPIANRFAPPLKMSAAPRR